MRELYGTGVPVPFECAYACKVKRSDCEKLEKALHKAFDPQRINANREFFQIKTEQVLPLLELFNKGDVTQEIAEEIENDLTTEDKDAHEKMNSFRRPSLDFFDMGLKKGDLLVYVKDSDIAVEILDAKKVQYHGESYFLTTITKKILGTNIPIRPTKYWLYEGRNLSDIYEETYTLE